MAFYRFTDYSVFTYIWVPVLIGMTAGLYKVYRSKKAISIFYASPVIDTGVSFRKKYIKIALMCTVLALLMFGLSGPEWNPQPITVRQFGRDIVVLLDVSKSMLCKDMIPSRLEQAKMAIEDLVKRLQGDRIALVAFSGAPKLICPLTVDYGYFLTVLKEVDVNTVQHGGTLIGDAVTFAAQRVFGKTGKAYRDMFLITDGEDHGSFPEKAAEIARKEKRIKIHAFGLGDKVTGAKVPVYDMSGEFIEYRKYKGMFVFSKLDVKNEMILEKMANISGGSYLSVGTESFDLGRIYEERILTAKRREITNKQSIEYRKGFQVFVLFALVLMLIDFFIGERKR